MTAINPILAEASNHLIEPTLWWLGQASFLLALGGKIILIDPCIALKGEDPLLNEINLKLFQPLPLRAEEIVKCDYVLLSHDHNDHVAPKTIQILNANTRCVFIGPAKVIEKIKQLGVDEIRCHEVQWRRTTPIPGFQVTATPALHEGLGEGGACGFIIEATGFRMWYPGDTDPMDEHLSYRKMDVMLLGIAAHVAGGQEGERLVKETRPRIVVPYHYGTFDVDAVWAKGDPEAIGKLVRPWCERYEVLPVGGKLTVDGKAK